jgi:hypothetical protein
LARVGLLAVRGASGSVAFEGRLDLGGAELAAGQLGRGRATLNALEREATARGFKLVARNAARLLTRGQGDEA